MEYIAKLQRIITRNHFTVIITTTISLIKTNVKLLRSLCDTNHLTPIPVAGLPITNCKL